MALAVTAALVALATTPIAFAILGRMDWFKARRGRAMQRPDVLVDRRRDDAGHGHPGDLRRAGGQEPVFDKNRYEFDPNKTWSVLEQGRGFKTCKEADEAVKEEMERLAESGRTWSTASRSSTRRCSPCGPWRGRRPRWRRRFPSVLAVAGRGPEERRGGRPAAVDGLHRAAGRPAADRRRRPGAPRRRAASRRRRRRRRAGRRPPAGDGLSQGGGRGRAGDRPRAPADARRDAAAGRLPPGWTVGKSGDKHHRDVQRRQPLREDRRPRRELPPVRRQGDGLRLLPPDRRRVERGPGLHLRDGRLRSRPWASTARRSPRRPSRWRSATEGTRRPAARSSTSGKYYTQIVSTTGRRQVRRLRPRPGQADRREAEAGRRRSHRQPPPQPSRPTAGAQVRRRPSRPPRRSPGDLLRPPARRSRARRRRSTSPRTSSATASSPTSSWPIIKDGDVTWQGFLRPYATPRRPRRSSRNTSRASRRTAPRSRRSQAEGADRDGHQHPTSAWSTSSSCKGNTVGGANGATDAKPGRGLRPGLRQEPARRASRCIGESRSKLDDRVRSRGRVSD